MQIELDPDESGITSTHAQAIADVCVEYDVFLFVRPSETETMVLIDAGFATKSMDIHDKSSNWGPMAGAVPLDRAFSKKHLEHTMPVTIEYPDRMQQKITQRAHDPADQDLYGQHGVEKPVQLTISERIRRLWIDRGKITSAEEDAVGTIICRPPETGGEIARNTTFVLAPVHADVDMLHLWDLPDTEENQTFWRVFWKWKDEPTLHPLFVWSYPVAGSADLPATSDDVWTHEGYEWTWRTFRPVTGDYDLWMVAPHLAWWKLNMHIVRFVDEHAVPSAATFFTNWLINRLNQACHREHNRVFQHGAEEQNYGHTQPLDKRLVMFTSSGNARVVSVDEMPQIMAELTAAGYQCLWNKRYDEVRPPLAGESYSPQVEAFEAARQHLDELIQEGANGAMVRAAQDKQQELHRRVLALDLEYDRISAFMSAFERATAQHSDTETRFERLTRSDIQERAKVAGQTDAFSLPADIYSIQLQLLRHIVNSTAAAGSGQSDLATLDDWLFDESENNLEKFERLSDAVEAAPGRNLPTSGGFLTKAADETGEVFRQR